MAKVSIKIKDLHECPVSELDFAIKILQKEKDSRDTA